VKEVLDTRGAVTVKMSAAGDGWQSPNEIDEVEMKFVGRDASGNVVQEQAEFAWFVLSQGHLPRGVEIAVQKEFKKGSAGVVKIEAGEWCNHRGGEESLGPLEYEVQVQKWHQRADVYSDGGVLVTCTTETDKYAKANDGAMCTFEIEGRHLDGTVFEPKAEKTISIGENSMGEALEQALTNVTDGQEAEIKMDERYGPEGCAAIYWVHVKDVRSTYSLSLEEQITGATRRKELGNTKLKAGDLQGASKAYNAGFKLVEHAHGETDQEKLQLAAVKLSIHLNLSLVLQKLGDEAACVQECNKALEIDASNVKAIYRCGAAKLKLGELNDAEKMFLRLQEIDPTLKEASVGLAQVKKKQKLMDKQDKALFAKMMSGVGKGKDEYSKPTPAPQVQVETSAETDKADAPVDV